MLSQGVPISCEVAHGGQEEPHPSVNNELI